MIPVLLWALATLDSAFAGYREAAGRSARINKQQYYRRAILTGAFLGQLAVVMVGILILVLLAESNDPGRLTTDLLKAGSAMLYVYIPYAAIVLLAFMVRAIPSVDLRSITSTVIFGPFTLMRPLIAIAGVVAGIVASRSLLTLVLGMFVLLLMLNIGRAIGWLRGYRTR